MKKRNLIWINLLFFLGIFLLTGCSAQTKQTAKAEDMNSSKIKVVATTTIVGDIISQVGGDLIELSVMLPIGTDPHGFNPTPKDIAKVADSNLVFANGAGLEEFLTYLLQSADAEDKIIYLSDGIEFLRSEGYQQGDHSEKDQHDQAYRDPHVWTDPNNVMIWIQTIEQKLSEADPENAQTYIANAEAYKAELQDLDAWIRDKVSLVPQENRKLVTDHALFGYMADEYGFEQVGALIPGYSTLSEPTAKELAAIEDAIYDLNVQAIFVGDTVNPSLAERVVEDTGAQLVFVYTGSLSEPDGEVGTYIQYMRYNINAFVDALSP